MKWIIDEFTVCSFKNPKPIFDYASKSFIRRGPTYCNELLLKCKIKCEYKDSKKGSKYLIFTISEDDIVRQKTMKSFEILMKTFFEICAIDFINIMPSSILNEFPSYKPRYTIFGMPENIANVLYHQKEIIFTKIFNRVQIEHSIENVEKDTRIRRVLDDMLWFSTK